MSIRKKNDGFSLVEMVVTVAIMAVLGGVLMPQVTQYIETSRVVKDKQTIQNIYMAVSTALISGTEGEERMDLAGDPGAGEVISLEDLAAGSGEFAKQMKLILGDSMGEITLESGQAWEHGEGKIFIYVGEDMRAGVYWGINSDSGQNGFTAGDLPEGVSLYD